MYYSFWLSYSQLKFAFHYFDQYSKQDEKFQTLVQLVAGGVTLVCLFGWSVFSNLSMLWSSLILASQIFALRINTLNPIQRTCATKYYLSELNSLLLEMSYKLRQIQNGTIKDPEEINELIKYFETEESKLDSKYFSSLYYPEKEDIKNIANQITDTELAKLSELGADTYAVKSTTTAAN